MQGEPLVSMVVPSFNHGRYVQACLRSIVNQTYRNIELIVIDDGSSDDSVTTIEAMSPELRERFVRFEFRSRPNKGLAETLNEGLAWCRGEYFAAIASDDVLLPEKTARLVEILEAAPGVAGAFGGSQIVDSGGNIVGNVTPPDTEYTFDDVLFREHVIVAPCQLLRTELVRAAGGYPKDLYIEDWYMWLKLTEHGARLKVIPEPLVLYRQHGTNISRNARKMFESRQFILGLYPDHPGTQVSMSKVCAMAAIDFSRVSKRESLSFLLQALRAHRTIVRRPIFWSALARGLAPASVLKLMSDAREVIESVRGRPQT